jgi:hypothetical protein
VDVWVKKVRTPVVDKWYKRGEYHHDEGEGLDYYSVGQSRGCGGTTIVADGKLHNSSNFTKYKVIADGPLRAVFELTYGGFDVGNGRTASEVKRFSIDAGSNMTRVETRFTSNRKEPLTVGVGIVQRDGVGHYTADGALQQLLGTGARRRWQHRLRRDPAGRRQRLRRDRQTAADAGHGATGPALRLLLRRRLEQERRLCRRAAWDAYVRGYAQS